MRLACFKKPLLEVGFTGGGERSEQGPPPRPGPRRFAEMDTAAPGPGKSSPAPSSLLERRTAPLGDFLPFLLLLLPRPPVCLPLSLFLAGGVCSCARPGFPSEREKRKKSLALKKKKNLSDLSPLLAALSKLELHTGFRSPSSSSSFLRSEPPEGVWVAIRVLPVLSSRACLPCPKT